MDTPTEDVFDIIADLASNALKCPIAAVSLIDRDRQWFKASVGLAQQEIPRNVSFCAHTIHSKEPVVVLDAIMDERFDRNPLVTGAASIRFYAGAPICSPTGNILGTIFVFDTRPRDSCDVATLEKLSNVAMKNLEDRKNAMGSSTDNNSIIEATPVLDSSNMTPLKTDEPAEPALGEDGDLPGQIVSSNNKVNEDAVVSGHKMEGMLMDLLCRTTETQQQLATQQGAMFQTLGQHTAQIDKLTDAVARMEAKLESMPEKR